MKMTNIMMKKELSRNTVLEAKNIYKYFDHATKTGLEAINLSLYDNEIVAILGQSGSGKSTLLRIISGLVRPTQGAIYYQNEMITTPCEACKMVFQHYALLPWMRVSENIAFGLNSNMHPLEKAKRVQSVITLIGLDGFENAYPTQLSGGMCQRVGFARALVTNPEILLLDEPFSALDAITARRLRHDFLTIWNENDSHIRSVVLVTHNVEEAVQMADRIIVLSAHPGRIYTEVSIPKTPDEKTIAQLIDKLYEVLDEA